MTARDDLSRGLFVTIAAVVALGALTAPAAATGDDTEIGVTVEGDTDGATIGLSAAGENESVTVPPEDSPGLPGAPEPPEAPDVPSADAPTTGDETVGVSVEGNTDGATVSYESPARDGSVSVPPEDSPAPEPGVPLPAAAQADEDATVNATVSADESGATVAYESPVRNDSVSVPPEDGGPSPGLPEPPTRPEPPTPPALPSLPGAPSPPALPV